MSDNNNGLGLLAGLATGAILGMLFAPNKGSKTRELIKSKATEASDKFIDEAESLQHKIADEASHLTSNVIDTINAKSQTLDEQLETIVTNTSYKADDLISSLEIKLANLKSKNKEIRKTVKK